MKSICIEGFRILRNISKYPEFCVCASFTRSWITIYR